MNHLDQLCNEPNKVIPFYVVENCPCLCTSLYADGNEEKNECSFFIDKKCNEVTGCKIRELIDSVLLEYMTEEETELSEQNDDRETHLIKCVKHNMAHMILCTLGYKEIT